MSQQAPGPPGGDAQKRANQAGDSNGRAASSADPKPLAQRIARSAYDLTQDAFAPSRMEAPSTISRSLQAGGKASGSAATSAEGAAAASEGSSAYQQAARSAASGSEARAASNALGASFRTGAVPPVASMHDDDAPAVLTETLDGHWQTNDKGKGRAVANSGHAWSQEFTDLRRPPAEDITVERLYVQPGDGMDVVNMLSDPGFNPEAAMMGDGEHEASDEASAEGLFSAAPESGLQQAESSRLIPADADVLTEMTGLKADESGNTRAATEWWLSEWSDVLENYTNYVWSPDDEERVQKARVELDKLKAAREEQSQGEQSQTVRRLRQILGHLDPKAVERSRPDEATPAQNERGQETAEVASRSPSPESWD